MGPPVPCGLGDASRCPLWSIDVATGVILDWNLPAARLCGWSKGGRRRSFGQLSQLFLPAVSARAKRITIAEILRLARGRRQEGRLLETRLVRPGRRTRLLALDAVLTGGQRRNESVLLIATLPRSARAVAIESGALSAIVGHELRNIAVPLEGFRDLAMQSAPENEPVRECLDETRIAVGRLTALASGLESLGEPASPPTQVPIGQCIPEDTADSLTGRWRIDWLCSPDTAVTVDRLHAQSAIRALIEVARRITPQPPSPLVLTMSAALYDSARCISCGAVLSRRVSARMAGSRPVDEDTLRTPFGAGRLGLTSRLTLAVLVHCAHQAGGHLMFDKTSGSPSTVFPSG